MQAKFPEASKTVSAALSAQGVEASVLYRGSFVAKVLGFSGEMTLLLSSGVG